MKEIVRNSLRTGLIFTLIGVAVAVAAPYLLTLIAAVPVLHATIMASGLAAVSISHVLNTAIIFGGFGILDPIMQPLFSFIFGKGKSEQTNQVASSNAPCDAKQLNINIQQAPGQAVQADPKFCKKVEADRSKAANNSSAINV